MGKPAFIATEELGKLVKWIRVAGYDCIYYRGKNESDIIIHALRDNRILLTRNSRLLKHKGIKIIIIKNDHIEDQIRQVTAEGAASFGPGEIFKRCVACNNTLETIDKRLIVDKVPEYVYKTHDEFKYCARCGKIFWRGTHWKNVEKMVAKLI